MAQEACVEYQLQRQLSLDPEGHTGGAEISFCPGGAHNVSSGGEEAATNTRGHSNLGLRTMLPHNQQSINTYRGRNTRTMEDQSQVANSRHGIDGKRLISCLLVFLESYDPQMISIAFQRGSASWFCERFPRRLYRLPPISSLTSSLLGSYPPGHSAGFSGMTGNTLLITEEFTLGNVQLNLVERNVWRTGQK